MSRPGQQRAGRAVEVGAAVAVVAVALLLLVAPLAIVLGTSRLLVTAVLVSGAWISVRRLGVIDLGTGAVAAVGAYAGAVWPAVVGLSPWIGLVVGGLAGSVLGGSVVAGASRVGRVASAVLTLAIGAAVVGALLALPGTGGAAGFHAVPLLTGSDRGDAIVALATLAGSLVALRLFDRSGRAAAGSVAVSAPAALAALGRRPVPAGGVAGTVSGVALGVGGVLTATSTGSVAPAAFGLSLSVALALAAAVGGRRPAAAVIGTVVVFGPSVLWPTVPILGDAPLLVLGPVSLGLLAWRSGGLLPRRGGSPAPPSRTEDASEDPPSPRLEPLALQLDDTPVVRGERMSLTVAPGEVVALVGPNGVGKSTVLARIAGQLDDEATVRLGGTSPERGPTARARTGIARTWQRPPVLEGDDLLRAGLAAGGDGAAARWARDVLGPLADTPAGRDLVTAVAQRPRVLLLDEPGAQLDPGAVARVLRGVAGSGAAVLVVEHRAEIVAIADRTLRLVPASPEGSP